MDIDIDLRPDFDPDTLFDITHASMEENGKLRKHQAGVYFQGIPVDKNSGLSTPTLKLNKRELKFKHKWKSQRYQPSLGTAREDRKAQ